MKAIRTSHFILIGLAAAAGLGGFWYGGHYASDQNQVANNPSTTQSTEYGQPVAAVETVPLKIAPISETISSYGNVVAQAGEVRALSVPFESQVARVLVTPGEQVTADTDTVQVDASPDAKLMLQEAKNAEQVASCEAAQVEERFASHLATNQERSQAQQSLQAAKLKLNSLLERGVDKPHRLKAGVAGIISKIDVQEGQIVAAGATLLQLAAGNRIEIRLGVEPKLVDRLHIGQSVEIASIIARAIDSITGTVRLITHEVNPDTHLTDIFVSIPDGNKLMINEFVRGNLTIASKQALLAPREATLVRESGVVLFTVSQGRAHKHVIKLGLSNGKEVEIIGTDLKPGEQTVIVGNAELEDGMLVSEENNL